MGAEDLELKAINVPVPNKKEKKKKKKKKRDLVDDEISTMGAKHFDLKVREASGQKEEKKKKNNKRGNKVDSDELHGGDDLEEPTMGEKLASLNLVDDVGTKIILEKERSSPSTKLPSADSVHVMLKQALHADDRVMLLDCLYSQDEKVISNSVSLLNPSDVLKLLDSLISIIQSRGAVLACALPWLRSLLLQHASGIMSQDSSLLALNSLYQLIESRVSTFKSALQLSSCLDYLFVGITDDMADEMSTITPVIYEDKSDSDEEDETEDAVESDRESEEQLAINGFSDVSDYMSE